MLLRRCRWLSKIRFTANNLQNLFWVITVDTSNTFALFAPSSYSDAVKQITRMFVDTCVVLAFSRYQVHDSMVFVHVVLTSVYLSLAFILLFLSE